jgi:hypothetical protein
MIGQFVFTSVSTKRCWIQGRVEQNIPHVQVQPFKGVGAGYSCKASTPDLAGYKADREAGCI